MAQQRDGVVYKEGNERHLKLTGKLYDQVTKMDNNFVNIIFFSFFFKSLNFKIKTYVPFSVLL